MIPKLEIDLAVSIISKYYRSAVERKNEKVQIELKKIMVTVQKLYNIAKEHNEVEIDE